MTQPGTPDLACITLGRRALHQLRASLERDTGLNAASYLQEAGFAGGEELFQGFAGWLERTYHVSPPADLETAHMTEVLGRFFTETGWGELSVEPLGDAVLALDSPEWAEAGDRSDGGYPTCHFSCGLLAEFLGRIAAEPVAVMEVECRSKGDPRCRFLAGAPETLSTVYDRMARGLGYEEALGEGGKAGGR